MHQALCRLAPRIALVLMVLLHAGCGKPMGVVAGKITLRGKPLSRGLITFLSEVDNQDAFSAAIINGEYRTSPIPCGPAKIIIIPGSTSTKQGPPVETGGSDRHPAARRRKPGLQQSVPFRYHHARTSGLQLNIDKKENTFNADLKR
jgi:hypothetical protein